MSLSLNYTLGATIISAGLKERLERLLDSFKNRGVAANLQEVAIGETTFFCLELRSFQRNPEGEDQDEGVVQSVRSDIVETVAETIVHDLEPFLLQQFLKGRKSTDGTLDSTQDSTDELLCAAREKFALYEAVRGPSRKHIVQRIRDYLRHHDTLNIEGFVRFRLRDYTLQLERALNRSIRQMEIKREKEELVQALRQLLELQEPTVERIHIIPHYSDSFHLVDDQGSVVQDEYLESFLWDLVDADRIDREELLLSALVTLAPNRIVCHLQKNSWQLAMVDGVFYDRMTYCGGCDRCRA